MLAQPPVPGGRTAGDAHSAVARVSIFSLTEYRAIVKLWENAWEEFPSVPAVRTETRRTVCTTNAIESVNARIRRAVKARALPR
ncbi:transposase [Streptomyces sp. NPDC058794]|uniref:transposase n=1 Tax=Streptomyces sp. NPDC058794 TaxID=3346636 RepID=UPI00368C5B52